MMVKYKCNKGVWITDKTTPEFLCTNGSHLNSNSTDDVASQLKFDGDGCLAVQHFDTLSGRCKYNVCLCTNGRAPKDHYCLQCGFGLSMVIGQKFFWLSGKFLRCDCFEQMIS